MGNETTLDKQVSAKRIRIGIFFILLFWLPFWLLAPIVDELLNISSGSEESHTVLITIMVIQGICGVIGVIIAGKPVYYVVKKSSKKKVLLILWNAFYHGKLEVDAKK